VACHTLHDGVPHMLTYADVGDGTWEFCIVNALGYLAQRRAKTFAVRPLVANAKRDSELLRQSLLNILNQLNDLCHEPPHNSADPRTDDVCLAAEIYWRLTGAHLTSLEDGTGPRRSVADLFATGGAIDHLMYVSQRQFQFGREVLCRLPEPPSLIDAH
jgi:hypothetical protein